MKLLALSLVATASADSTVSKVITLLDELKGKVQKDLDTEAAAMEGYNKWCETQKTETSYAIKDETRVIGEQSALAESGAAGIEENNAKISELGSGIASAETEMKEAEKVRAEQQKAFLAAEKELTEAEDMLGRAYSILERATKKGGAFIQGGQMEEVVQALGAIVQAGWVDPLKAQKINSFVQDDLSLAQAPQASTSNYDSKSGGILQTIDEMREETMTNLRDARTKNTKEKHAHELFHQGKVNEVATMNKELSSAKENLAAAQTKLGNAQKALKEEQAAKAADEKYYSEVSQSCTAKANMWAERQESATQEMAALDQAKEVLASKVVVLAQTGSRTRRVSADDMEKRSRVVSTLRRLGRRFNSFGLLQAASAAQADPFEKVRGLIKQMIAKLEKQAADEASFKETCDKNIAENTAKKAKKQSALEKYNTRYGRDEAKITKLGASIAELRKELEELAAGMAEATAQRNKSNAENTKIVADNKQSAEAVAEATNVLRQFYEGGDAGAAFVQKGEAAPVAEFAAAKGDSAHTIIAILETAQADFTKLYEETEAEEAQEAADYKKLVQEAEVTKSTKEASILGQESQIKNLKVNLGETQGDIDSTTTELDEVSKSLAAWQEKCANKAMSYEERKQRREAELAGLKEALEVLSSDEPASAFLQRRN